VLYLNCSIPSIKNRGDTFLIMCEYVGAFPQTQQTISSAVHIYVVGKQKHEYRERDLVLLGRLSTVWFSLNVSKFLILEVTKYLEIKVTFFTFIVRKLKKKTSKI